MRRVSKSNHHHRGSIASVATMSHEPHIAHTNQSQFIGTGDPNKPMINTAKSTPNPTGPMNGRNHRGRLVEQRCNSTEDPRWSSYNNNNTNNPRKISDASSCPSSVVSARSNSKQRTNTKVSPQKERPHRAHCQRFNHQGNSHDNTSSSHSKHAHNNRTSNKGCQHANESCSSKSSTSGACSRLSCSEDGDASSSSSTNDDHLPYPGFPEVALKYLTQDARPRNWCLMLITNPWFERISILVILLNCITLGMYQPCVDDACVTNRCKVLQLFDDIIFAFFSLEMTIKMMAMGMWGKNTYLADSWNRLDFFIVVAGAFEYCLHMENLNLTAIRTIRVLRPLRAINRIPSMRILVMLLLDTLPMLGNVLLLCFFVFFIFGIVGVQLWEGILRQRCVLQLPDHVASPKGLSDEFRVRVRINSVSFYYEFSKEQDYICTKPEDSGMHTCSDLPQFRVGPMLCNASALTYSHNLPTNTSCVNWNQYYTNCTQLGGNPFQGTISFDNIGMAWVAIFLVISLEGWTDIMYYVQDAHSFWDWIYFVLLIVIGSFFMINLCLVVIATQFSETKKREMERMRQERLRYTSTSTLASSTNNSEPATCYGEIVKYIAHLYRRTKRRLIKKIRLYKYQRQLRQQEEGLLHDGEILTLSPNRIRHHHPKCLNHKSNEPAANTASSDPTGVKTGCDENRDGSSSEPHSESTTNRMSGAANGNYDLDDVRLNRAVGNMVNMPMIDSDQLVVNPLNPNVGFLNLPNTVRRRSAVMFNDYVILHSNTPNHQTNEKNSCSSEKMTQTSESGSTIWQVNLPNPNLVQQTSNGSSDFSDLAMLNETMTCQELLAFSVAFSAALPTNQTTLETFYSSLIKPTDQASAPLAENSLPTPRTQSQRPPAIDHGSVANGFPSNSTTGGIASTHNFDDFSCCADLHQQSRLLGEDIVRSESNSRMAVYWRCFVRAIRLASKMLSFVRRYVRRLVEQKYFQQGILLAILINTLSMGIEYHNQPEELTVIVETSNIVFSCIFALEMMLKVVAEGPFRYIANGFNVFDGVIVILSVVELCQEFFGDGAANSGLSVLRTFRLLRILKLVRFMPNLRRQLFVMLRTMDNVAIFFSLLILFIFIFSILGMYLFGGKFCKFTEDNGQERECTCPEIISKHPHCECDRKHFNNILWATVTVFQILTQEDWNVVLFNGMEKTSHWAALYFVALMTFGNYVLFNLLVAILVEGFSSERNERREREQRELVKKLREENETINDMIYDEVTRSCCSESTTTSESEHIRNRWHSAEDIRKVPKCNIMKQLLSQPGGGQQQQSNTSRSDCSCGDSDKSSRHNSDNSIERNRNAKHLKRTFSVKDKSSDPHTQNRPPNRDPPTIITTAATPQDSPNTTIDGTGVRRWDSIDTYSPDESTLSLLKPPSIMSGSCVSLQVESKSSVPRKRIATQPQDPTEHTPPLEAPSAEQRTPITLTLSSGSTPSNPPSSFTKKSGSFKKFARSSSKKLKLKPKPESTADNEVVVLNNGRDTNMPTSDQSPSLSASANCSTPLLNAPHSIRIQNDTTKDINKISPQNSFRRQLATRRLSVLINNTQQQHQLQQQQHLLEEFTRQNALKNTPSGSTAANNRRRMSSFENTFEKASNLNMYSMENMNSASSAHDLHTSKLNLAGEVLSAVVGSRKCSTTESVLAGIVNVNEANNNNNNVEKTFSHHPKFTKHLQRWCTFIDVEEFVSTREEYSLYVFSPENRFRNLCVCFVNQKWFDNVILLFIALNCITLAMERPNIPPNCPERVFLGTANYVFTAVFTLEMMVKVVAAGMFYGEDAYFNSGWNIMDGSLVSISIIDLLMSLLSDSSPRIFGILRVFRLLRSLRPLRVINRAPGLKLVVQTLLSSLRPIGNIVLICCTFFIIFGILGVQLFKGTFFYCEGINIKTVRNRTDCLSVPGNVWINRKYNFDDLGKALMSLFVLSSRDGWVNIMYTGLDAVGVDQQPVVNYNEWRLLYFIAFILLVGFFVLNMFVGVVVENFHRCREEQEKEEKIRRAAKRALQMEKKRRRMHEPPYYMHYSPIRMFVHNVVTSKYFDLAIAAVIGLNVITMALEYYMMPVALEYALKIFNYFFTAVFILESSMKLVALGVKIYMREKWNQLDVGIVMLSVVGIVLEELETNIIPINPTIIRVMRVMRIARVLKLLKMAKGIRALLDTVMQALPQVGNLGLLFFLLFFIFAALGVELFGRLECSEENPCQGLGEHAHFANFGMAFLTLFRVATGDNWNGIMKDTLRDDCDDAADCVGNCCVSTVIAPIFFVIFVLMAQFVLVNVVVAVLMKHLEESHKQMEDEHDMDTELAREFAQEQQFEEDQVICMQLQEDEKTFARSPLAKILSLPPNFTFTTPMLENKFKATQQQQQQRRQSISFLNQVALRPGTGLSPVFGTKNNNSISEAVEGENQTTPRRLSNARRGWARKLKKEMSLDEDSDRRRDRMRLHVKRMSLDNIPTTAAAATRRIPPSTVFEDPDQPLSRGKNPQRQRLSDPYKPIFTHQHASLEEEADIDESSMLLPDARPEITEDLSQWVSKEQQNENASSAANKKLATDSREIRRIISERRMLERGSTCDEEHNEEDEDDDNDDGGGESARFGCVHEIDEVDDEEGVFDTRSNNR